MKSLIIKAGPKPGNDAAVRQQKAIAMGTAGSEAGMPIGNLFMGKTKTGRTRVPGSIGSKK